MKMKKNNILSFNEFIKEGLWNKGLNRSKTDSLRKEDGTKVKTCFNSTVVLKNPNYDYNKLIKDLLNNCNSNESLEMTLSLLSDYDTITQEKLTQEKLELDFLIQNNIVIGFYSYDDLIDNEDIDDNLPEEDYLTIIKSIVDFLKNENIVITDTQPTTKNGFFAIELLNHYDVERLEDIFVHNKYDDNDYGTFMSSDIYDSYKKAFNKKYNNSYDLIDSNDGIYIKTCFDAFINYKELCNFTKEYFNNFIEDEDQKI